MYALALGLVLTVLGTAGLALAQSDYPDLRGTWTGASEAIIAGNTNHYEGAEAQKPVLRSLPFTMVVDMQEGRRFSGTFGSEHSTEQIVGVIGPGGAVLWIDQDGYVQGELRDPDTLEACYLQVDARAQVASCAELKRQR